jgi:hypothetical protein
VGLSVGGLGLGSVDPGLPPDDDGFCVVHGDGVGVGAAAEGEVDAGPWVGEVDGDVGGDVGALFEGLNVGEEDAVAGVDHAGVGGVPSADHHPNVRHRWWVVVDAVGVACYPAVVVLLAAFFVVLMVATTVACLAPPAVEFRRQRAEPVDPERRECLRLAWLELADELGCGLPGWVIKASVDAWGREPAPGADDPVGRASWAARRREAELVGDALAVSGFEPAQFSGCTARGGAEGLTF